MKPTLPLWIAGAIMLALMLTGCGITSVNCRHQKTGSGHDGWDAVVYSKKYVYPAVEGDCKGMVAPCLPGIRGDAQVGAAVFGSVCCFFDLPISLVVDTICLPYDLYKVTCGGKTRAGDDRAPKPVAP